MQDLATLTPEQAIGQFFFLGLPGAQFNDATQDLLDEIQPGGVIVFARSVRQAGQLRDLLDEVRAALPVPPLVSIDQEGGLVDRLRRISTPMPSARTLREAGDVAHWRTLGSLTGEILRLLGCNMNFAPVLDLLDEERAQLNNALQTRVLGYTPEAITRHATAYLDGLQSAGVLGCVKHFPGLGAGAVDSHEALPIINLSRQEMQEKDLAPYAELFAQGAPHAVMVAHGYYPQLSPHHPPLPSSLDGHIINDLLRGEMGWQGLVMSDDLEMGAIAKHATIEEAVVQHIQAGADMALICATPEVMRRGYYALLEAVQCGDISAERVQASLGRIAAVKARTQPPAEFDTARLQELSNAVAALNKRLE